MKNFLGRGISFPLQVGGYGALETSHGEQNIEQSVRLILGTAIGERVMRPRFGCKIHDLVFHPVSANTCSIVALYVEEALSKWEPRIDQIRCNAYPDPVNENTIIILIDYLVRSTNSMKNMVYPFYLRREQDL